MKPKAKKFKWQETGTYFINPYNFVSLEGSCSRKSWEQYRPEAGAKLLTGYLRCRLNPRTPVFIPNTSHLKTCPQRKDCLSYDFFSDADLTGREAENPPVPVIPASEIRGVVRSVYETVTNSCLSTADSGKLLYKRTSLPGRPGFLKRKQDGRWYLEKAERVMLKVKKCDRDQEFRGPQGQKYADLSRYREGEKVRLEKSRAKYKGRVYMPYTVKCLEKYDQSEGTSLIQGFIHKGEAFAGKHHESVFVAQAGAVCREVDQETVDRLLAVLRLYDPEEKINITPKHSGYAEYKALIKAKLKQKAEAKIPVYYNIHNGICYLSPGCISKEVFQNKLEDILENQGGFQPCRERENVCPACALFGMVGKHSALASRVRFTDARIVGEVDDPARYYHPLMILPELSAPKISATEFYLQRPGLPQEPGPTADTWNYDYAVMWSPGKDKWQYIKDYRPRIRGRKFYWHCKTPGWLELNPGHAKKYLNKRNCVIRPLKAGAAAFECKVYFEDITEDELQKLAWSLNLGGNENSRCHKIGRGKPVGLGSVKITVEEIKLRRVVWQENKINYLLEDYKLTGLSEAVDTGRKSIKELIKITDFANCPTRVAYPSLQWFTANREMEGGTPQKPVVKQVLPAVGDKDTALPELKRV